MSVRGAESFDAIVAGGGLAGAATARLLAARGLRVAIFEKDADARRKTGEILAPNAIAPLEGLGLLDTLDRNPRIARPCSCILRSWGTSHVLRSDFIRRRGGRAWVVDRLAFDAWNLQLAAEAGVAVETRSRIVGAKRSDGVWQVQVFGPRGMRTVRAAFAVDATGRAAVVACRLGATRLRPYRLLAIHCHLSARSQSIGCAELHIAATASGWWYAVKGPSGFTTVFLTDPESSVLCKTGMRDALSKLAKDAPSLREMVDSAIRDGQITVADASAGALSQPSGDGWLAVGDAAACHDPLASQGIPNALATAAAGALAIYEARGGNAAAVSDYAAKVVASWRNAVTGLAPIYGAARRWPASTFWDRHSRPLLHRDWSKLQLD